jgi:hypothetical protein
LGETLLKLTLALHVGATAAMTGLVWFVQVVHYPLMARVAPEAFGSFERAHMMRTGWVVAPLMLTEAASCAALVAWRPAGVSPWMVWSGAVLLAAIWASTFLVQVPLHERLSGGWDADAHAKLVAWNWPRTIMWTARAGLAALMAVSWKGGFG